MTTQAEFHPARTPIRFKTGGKIFGDYLYVERPADNELLEVLLAGEFAYVLAPRQIGKSSLSHHAVERLQERGVQCVSIDLGEFGGSEVTEEQWYLGLVEKIAEGLGLPDTDVHWQQGQHFSPVHRFSRYLRAIVRDCTERQVVIFIDEIDAIMKLPFGRSDFLTSIRAIYNGRADEPALARLTFCLIGVTTPAELCQDARTTPFNVGHGIRIEDFRYDEAQAFAVALQPFLEEPEVWLTEVFRWTDGHPYMTVRICDRLRREAGTPPTDASVVVAKLVDQLFLQTGRIDETNLSHAEDRILRCNKSPTHISRMLRTYLRLLDGDVIAADDGDSVQRDLCLAGLTAYRGEGTQRLFRVRNRIFATVFDHAWVKTNQAQRDWSDALSRWLQGGKRKDDLLQGTLLRALRQFATDHPLQITDEESSFLLDSTDERSRILRRGIALLLVGTVLLTVLAWDRERQYQRASHEVTVTAEAMRQRKDSEKKAVQAAQERLQANSKLERVNSDLERAVRTRDEKSRALQASRDELAQTNRKLLDSNRRLGHAEAELREKNQALEFSNKDVVAKNDALQAARKALEANNRTLMSQKAQLLAEAGKPGEALLLGILAAAPEYASGSINPENWHGLAVASYEYVPPRTVISQHAPVSAIQVLPDGRIVTALRHSAVLWGPNGQRQRVFDRHQAAVTSLAVSSDGKLLATGSKDKTAMLWSIDTGEVVRVLRGHANDVTSVAFSRSNTWLVTTSADSYACVWDTKTGGLHSRLGPHNDVVNSAEFTRDEKEVVTRVLYGTVFYWERDSGRKSGHVWVGRGTSLAIAPSHWNSDQLILAADRGGLPGIFRWTGSRGEFHGTASRPEPESAESDLMAVSMDGTFVMSQGAEPKIWHIESRGHLLTLHGQSAVGRSAAFTRDGRSVLIGGDDGRVQVWEFCSDIALRQVLSPGNTYFRSATISPDGKSVASLFADSVRVVGLDRPAEVSLHHLSSPTLLRPVYSPDSRWLVAVTRGLEVNVWDLESRGYRRFSLPIRTVPAWVTFSGDGNYLDIVGSDGGVQRWNTETWRQTDPWPHSDIRITALTYASHSQKVAVISKDNELWIGDLRSELRQLKSRNEDFIPSSIAFSSDGRKLLVTSESIRTKSIEKPLLLYEENNEGRWELQNRFKTPPQQIVAAAISPDGNRIAALDKFSRLNIWEGKPPRSARLINLYKHRPASFFIEDFSFSQDSRYLIMITRNGLMLKYLIDERGIFKRACEIIENLPARFEDEERKIVQDICQKLVKSHSLL